MFIFAYAGLADLHGSWFAHYLLLVAVYGITAGAAYLISIVSPRELSQLVGVIALLIFMMFSGSNPTLHQLQENVLLGKLLYYPSFGSFLRFSNELFYLIEAKAYHINAASMLFLYDYQLEDFERCVVFLVAFFFIFRLVAYLALVVRENLKSSGSHYTFKDLLVAYFAAKQKQD